MIRIYNIIFSLYYFLISIEAIYISPCAKWNTTGITILGTNSPGNASNQLHLPQAMFFHKKSNGLYIADTSNRRIQMFLLNSSSNTAITILSNIDSMSAIYVDDDDESIIYVALRYENRIEKWNRNSLSGERVGNQCKQCTGVWLDQEKNVYMTESGTHSILKWSKATNISINVAGQIDQLGKTADRLYFPRSTYVSSVNNTFYVADMRNNRIQKWNINSKEGITVAGSSDGISGYDNSKLASPSYVWVDEQSGVIYIVDNENNRIQRWLPNASIGSTIVGRIDRGNANDQLSSPNTLAFDDIGNLYVCDGNNHRIQMFQLIENKNCPTSINHSNSIHKITILNVNVFMLLLWVILTKTILN